MFLKMITSAQHRFAAYRRYRQVISEIEAMSNNDLLELGVFQVDLYRAARKEILG